MGRSELDYAICRGNGIMLEITFPENRMTWNSGMDMECHLDGKPWTTNTPHWPDSRPSPVYHDETEASYFSDTLTWLSENHWTCSFYSLLHDRSYNYVDGIESNYPSINDLAYGFTDDPGFGSVTTPSLECCIDAKVPVWLVIERDMTYDVIDKDSTPSDYDTLIAPYIDSMEDDPAYDAVVGYSWEAGFDIGPQWLREHLDEIGSTRLIGQQFLGEIFHMEHQTTPAPYYWLNWLPRLPYLDYVIWDFFDTREFYDLTYAPWTLSYIIENYPTIKWGIQECTQGLIFPYWNDDWGMWATYQTLPEKERRMHTCLGGLKTMLGACDIVDVGVAAPVGMVGETMTYIEQCEDALSLRLTESTPNISVTNIAYAE